MIPEKSGHPVPVPAAAHNSLYRSTPTTPPLSPGPQGPITSALSSLNIPNSSLETRLKFLAFAYNRLLSHSSD
jgi:hypothetical protein